MNVCRLSCHRPVDTCVCLRTSAQNRFETLTGSGRVGRLWLARTGTSTIPAAVSPNFFRNLFRVVHQCALNI